MKAPLPLLAVALTALSISTVARADLSKLLNALTPPENSTTPSPTPPASDQDFSTLVNATTGDVLLARIELLKAQADLAAALGVKNESLIAASEALSAVSGASTSPGKKVKALKDSTKTTAEARQQLSESLNKSSELSAEARAKFFSGAGKFARGVMLERAQILAIKQLVEKGQALSKSSNTIEKLSLVLLVKPTTDLAVMVPGDVKEAFTVLGQISAFANKHNLEMPSEAEQLNKLGDVGDL